MGSLLPAPTSSTGPTATLIPRLIYHRGPSATVGRRLETWTATAVITANGVGALETRFADRLWRRKRDGRTPSRDHT